MMETMKTFLLLIFSMVQQFALAQIDSEEIRKRINENPTNNYYSLLKTFKETPSHLNQEELNLIYYGSKLFNKSDSKAKFDEAFQRVFKKADVGMSKRNAEKVVADAEKIYHTSPMDMTVLTYIINIYKALNDEDKLNLAIKQQSLLLNTVKLSGDGLSEQSPICIINHADMFVLLNNLFGESNTRDDFTQNFKQLPQGDVLWNYNYGNKQLYIKLIGGFY